MTHQVLGHTPIQTTLMTEVVELLTQRHQMLDYHYQMTEVLKFKWVIKL